MRALVFGGRKYDNRYRVAEQLGALRSAYPDLLIGCGYDPMDRKFQGADQLAYEWAKAAGVHGKVYPAHWRALGNAAGPARNSRQLERFKPTIGIGFPGGVGTGDMARKCLRAGVPVYGFTDRDWLRILRLADETTALKVPAALADLSVPIRVGACMADEQRRSNGDLIGIHEGRALLAWRMAGREVEEWRRVAEPA